LRERKVGGVAVTLAQGQSLSRCYFFPVATQHTTTKPGGERPKSIGAGNKVSRERAKEDELLVTASQLISRRVIAFNEGGSHLILISPLFVSAVCFCVCERARLFCVPPESAVQLGGDYDERRS